MIADYDIKWLTKPDFLKNKIGDPNLAHNEIFRHFLLFVSLVFLEMAYNNSLQQCLTSRRGKVCEKNVWGPNLGQKSQN